MIFGMSYYQICLYFILYSFLGWCVEIVFHAFVLHKIINRGFLNGPVCPIYGFGILAVFSVINTASARVHVTGKGLGIILLYITGVILATLAELIGGFTLDKVFHARWWDYSGKAFNFRGYICLRFSLSWGLGIVFIVKGVHPFLVALSFSRIPTTAGWWILLVLYLVYLTDFLVSVLVMLRLNQELEELDELQLSMRQVSNSISLLVGEGTFAAQDLLNEGKEKVLESRARLSKSQTSNDPSSDSSDGNESENGGDRSQNTAAGEPDSRQAVSLAAAQPDGPSPEISSQTPEPASSIEEFNSSHLLETREEFEEKKTARQEAAKASVKKAMHAALAAKDAALAAGEAAMNTARKTSAVPGAVKRIVTESAEKLLDPIEELLLIKRSLEREKSAWLEHFAQKHNLPLRRFLDIESRFMHNDYPEALEEVRREIQETDSAQLHSQNADTKQP